MKKFKLKLHREVVRVLAYQLARVRGGQEPKSGWPPCTGSGNCPSQVQSCYMTDCTSQFTTL